MKRKIQCTKTGTIIYSNIAFTLLELLIVVAIIMMLAAILLPALARAKHLSKGVACTNNLKNISMGFNMYATDWNGYFVPYMYSSDTYIHWPFGIDPYVGGQAKSGWTFSCRRGYGSSMVWYCPAGPYDSTYTSSPSYRSDYVDYAYNIILGGYDGVYKQMHSISQPTKVLLCLDSKFPGVEVGIAYLINNSDSRIHARHNNRFNALFVDGHIQNFRPASLSVPISTNLIAGTW